VIRKLCIVVLAGCTQTKTITRESPASTAPTSSTAAPASLASPCLSAKGCASTLPMCSAGAHGIAVATAFTHARATPNKIVHVEGVLRPSHTMWADTCDARCCNEFSASPAVADPNSAVGETIGIGSVGDSGLWERCIGDESLVCCGAPDGSRVLVTGRLLAAPDAPAVMLFDANACRIP